VKPLVLTLRERPDQRLDCSPLVPFRLAGKSAKEIAKLPLNTTRMPLTVGDVFDVRMGEAARVLIAGSSDRFDQIGQDLDRGEIIVEGDVGAQAGRLMAGGTLTILGNAGPWAASGMKGGLIAITGSAGDRIGGPLAGETAGMRGGVVIVRRNAGERAGDKLRRGTIIIDGDAGPYAGSRMIAGTLIVRGKAGPLPGYLMHRGTIVLGGDDAELSPTFMDCGVHSLLAMRLLASFVQSHSPRAAALLRKPLRRLAGDMAALGKGEIFTPS
jgi:formylmethanofuran dehydrogenase subunit C